jgi:glycerol-3-phosphate dehydrogenase (NAD(P)+)
MNAAPFEKIAVLGAGSWGTALAVWLAARGRRVTLWGHDAGHIARLRESRENAVYLPGIELRDGIEPVTDLRALEGADLALFVTPSRALDAVASELASVRLADAPVLLSCTKGLEYGTGRRMSEILAARRPHASVAVLSGPSHAEEVARNSPAAVVLGSASADAAGRLQSLFNAASLRAYTSDDVPGIELGGALKNIYAIAAGMSDGLGLGDNAKAALVTRCLAELVRLGTRLGGRRETFQGLSGVGDLMVTCFSRHSRNRLVGERLGCGESLDSITASMCMIAEGVPTARSAYACARQLGIDTPVLDQVHAILFEGRPPLEALRGLFLRDPRPETETALTEGDR